MNAHGNWTLASLIAWNLDYGRIIAWSSADNEYEGFVLSLGKDGWLLESVADGLLTARMLDIDDMSRLKWAIALMER